MSCMWSIYSIKRTAEKNGVAPCLTGGDKIAAIHGLVSKIVHSEV